jgi:phenylacetate-CoA ligase
MDPKRLLKWDPKEIDKLRDKAFRRIVKYAYSCPMYHTKYKQAGVHPEDVRGIQDITKLPFVTKKDLIEHYPNGIIPTHYNRKKARVICTSGSSGKPLLHIYIDFSVISGSMSCMMRLYDRFDMNWRKSRFAHVGNFTSNHADLVVENSFFDQARLFYSFKNRYLPMNGFDPIQTIVKRLNEFKPDLILTYPATYRHLAYYKRKGKAPHINPKVALVSASITDEYTRKYVEEAFGCRMLNTYASTESLGEVAFECEENTWHINHDIFHVEAVDTKMHPVDYGKKGRVAITRLYGKATPVVRYAGMDDWVTLVASYDCECGYSTPIMKEGVEGRVSASIFLPNGRLFSAASFASMSHFALNELNTSKVVQFQIVQKKIDEIDFLMVIDDDLRDEDPSTDIIFKKIEDTYREKVGSKVTLNVKEVKKIKSSPGKPPLLVISHVKPEDGYKMIDL